MSKLVCKKCGGTLFVPTGERLVSLIHVPNGFPPYTEGYRCVACGNRQGVRYPATYYDKQQPQEIEIPEIEKEND